jgi:hypothetical protein
MGRKLLAGRETFMAFAYRVWIAGVIRWSARTIGTLVAVVFFAFLFGEGFGPPGAHTLNPFVLSIPDLAVLSLRLLACIGLCLAWRWEALGGGIALVGILAATILRPWVAVAAIAMSVPGVLYLLSWLLRRPQRLMPAH